MTAANRAVVYQCQKADALCDVVDGRGAKLRTGEVMWWRDGELRQRRMPIRAIVLHHTAGEGNACRIYRTLRRRVLSVHFTIDRSGIIVQHADVDRVCQHAGPANQYSVGVEIANRGVAPAAEHAPRKEYAGSVHGRARTFLAFYPAQIESAAKLCASLCGLLGLPFEYPRNEDGSLVLGRLTREREDDFRGVLGHFHVSSRKVDPSPHIFDEMTKWRRAHGQP